MDSRGIPRDIPWDIGLAHGTHMVAMDMIQWNIREMWIPAPAPLLVPSTRVYMRYVSNVSWIMCADSFGGSRHGACFSEAAASVDKDTAKRTLP